VIAAYPERGKVLVQAVNGYLYSILFWLPSKIGLPVLPPIFAREAIGTGVPVYRFASGRGNFA
jgi:hypothetical protein